MPEESPKPDARPMFRKLAGGVGVVCLLLAALFAMAPAEMNGKMASYACGFVGVVMTGIAMTGRWPWWGQEGKR